MPKAAVLSVAVEIAANCAAGSATFAAIQARTVCAFVIVSIVVKVFEATITSVVSGSSPESTSCACAPSTFEMKCSRGPSAKEAQAIAAITGPRSEPPMPILTTSVMRPPCPVNRPVRTSSAKACIRPKVSRSAGITS